MAKAKSGGGITSRNVVRPGVRTGSPATGYNPGRVGQIGAALGDHSEYGRVHGDPREAPHTARPHAAEMRLGNEVATNVGKGGPGTGRTVYRTGQQGTHGKAVAGTAPARKSIFPGFG
jgi:hypothetical protein